MFGQLLWWAPIALQAALLIGAIRARLFAKYPIFYAYLSYVFVETSLRLCIYVVKPGFYSRFYWYTQCFSVALGYGVIWEIFRQALAEYPGAARMAKNALAAIFLVVVSKVLFNALTGPVFSPATTTAELERNLWAVQAVLLVAIVGLLAYYAIPTGRNLKGTILGYGFSIGASVMSLTLRSYLGDWFQPWWQYLPAMTSCVTLLIWCFTLWSYRPNPEPESDVGIERDYELLVARTTKLLTQARGHLVRAMRP
jgi:hypothetical protein